MCFQTFLLPLQNVTLQGNIDCLAYWDVFFVQSPFNVKENDVHTLRFALQLLIFLFWCGLTFLLVELLLCLRVVTIQSALITCDNLRQEG